MRETPPSRLKKDAATYVAVLGLFALVLGLLLLVLLVSPVFLGIVAVIAVFLFVAVFHYMAWGWWAGSAGPPRDDDELDR